MLCISSTQGSVSWRRPTKLPPGLRCSILLAVVCAFILPAGSNAQEQVDLLDAPPVGSTSVEKLTLRLRVKSLEPKQPQTTLEWRRGGEGLGGLVTRGQFTAANEDPLINVGAWTAPVSLDTMLGRARTWQYPTIVVRSPMDGKRAGPPITRVEIEFEFADDGKPLKTFTESAPRGATVSFAFPGEILVVRGLESPQFLAALQGVSGHALTRLKTLQKALPEPAAPLKEFAVIGHLAGYSELPGFGVRHSNPQIVADECRTLQLLGVNGLVGAKSVQLADAAGVGDQFRKIYWGGPGSGSPMNMLARGKPTGDECPFDPRLKELMGASVQAALAEHRTAGAARSWALWWDEMGVAAKAHHQSCPRCREEFREYLKAHKVSPADLGQETWDDIGLYPIWKTSEEPGKEDVHQVVLPDDPQLGLHYYYSFRFMTYATGKLFPEAAKTFKEAGIPLYAMQGPTPSWNGATLDWNEFYDLGANTAMVWETSNRDPRAWQWESYLGDIARGIARRHDIPIGVLIKPHRGAPEQRLLSVVSRGATVVEWYTYGPDYAKGDSFSQSPELLQRVAQAGRFLGAAEKYVYNARWAGKAEVAFVSPRSSEIWSKPGALEITPFENAKWVYFALAHAHVPVDVLSEQQLAEGKLDGYKAIYVSGSNLRRDAAAQLRRWVEAGGCLWTDALGLSRDEANQPLPDFAQWLGKRRVWDSYGVTPPYRATDFKPLVRTNLTMPTRATVSLTPGAGETKTPDAKEPFNFVAEVGREPHLPDEGDVLARFVDGKPAMLRHRIGRGSLTALGFWSGLSYSAKVRRPDYDMHTDFDPALRELIVGVAIASKAYRPVVVSDPQVEAVALERNGQRSVALMNWSHAAQKATPGGARWVLQPQTALQITFLGEKQPVAVRSLRYGKLELKKLADGGSRVTLPRLDETDLLVLE